MAECFWGVPVRLFSSQFAVLTGADVIAVGRSAGHLQVAQELGASEVVDSTKVDPGAYLEDSLDAVLTFAPSDVVNAGALRALKWGGTLVTGVPLTFAGFPFNKNQTVIGTLLGNRGQMNAVLRLAAEGKVRTVVDRFPMAEAAEVLQKLASGELRSRAVLEN